MKNRFLAALFGQQPQRPKPTGPVQDRRQVLMLNGAVLEEAQAELTDEEFDEQMQAAGYAFDRSRWDLEPLYG